MSPPSSENAATARGVCSCGHAWRMHRSVLPPEGVCSFPGCVCNGYAPSDRSAAQDREGAESVSGVAQRDKSVADSRLPSRDEVGGTEAEIAGSSPAPGPVTQPARARPLDGSAAVVCEYVHHEETGEKRQVIRACLYEMRLTFTATGEQAEEFRRTLEAAAAVFFYPTEKNAAALFELGAAAIVRVAQAQRKVAACNH